MMIQATCKYLNIWRMAKDTWSGNCTIKQTSYYVGPLNNYSIVPIYGYRKSHAIQVFNVPLYFVTYVAIEKFISYHILDSSDRKTCTKCPKRVSNISL